MMKTGHVEKTVDRDYEIEERRYRTMESAANKLQKEAKGYLDSLRGTNPETAPLPPPAMQPLLSEGRVFGMRLTV